MTTVVMDASAAIGILRDEPLGPALAEVVRGVVADGGTIVVPAHFWLEVANVLRTRHKESGHAIVEAIHKIDTFGPMTIDLDRSQLLLVIDAMERHGLSGYDATYLVLARTLDAMLLTQDKRLNGAAGSLAIPLPGDHRLGEDRAPYLTDREARPTWPDYSELSAFLSKLRADAIRDREAVRR